MMYSEEFLRKGNLAKVRRFTLLVRLTVIYTLFWGAGESVWQSQETGLAGSLRTKAIYIYVGF